MAEQVLIGCKLPNGVQLRVGNTVHALKGVAVPAQARGNRAFPTYAISDSAAFTSVPKDFWDEWKRLHGSTYVPYVRGFIFDAKDIKSGKAEASEKAKEVTGFEAVDPTKKKNGLEAEEGWKKNPDNRPAPPIDFSENKPHQSVGREVPRLPQVQNPVPVPVQVAPAPSARVE